MYIFTNVRKYTGSSTHTNAYTCITHHTDSHASLHTKHANLHIFFIVQTLVKKLEYHFLKRTGAINYQVNHL